jgi:hypothetical protein
MSLLTEYARASFEARGLEMRPECDIKRVEPCDILAGETLGMFRPI